MRKKLLGVIVLIGIVSLCVGCQKKEVKKVEPTKEKTTKFVVKYNDLDNMKKVSNLAFQVEKESMDVKDYDDATKGEIARGLVSKNLEDVTGTELLNAFKKYFGEDQTIEFQGIKCKSDHGSAEANVMYKFDKNQDKYVYNDKHPGHGGGSANLYGYYMDLDQITEDEDGYQYDVKVLFYGPATTSDTGPMSYGNGYKSYSDAKSGQNEVVKINDNEKYTTTVDGFPVVEIEKVFTDNRDKLDTYTFTFAKDGDNLVFKSYKKKA